MSNAARLELAIVTGRWLFGRKNCEGSRAMASRVTLTTGQPRYGHGTGKDILGLEKQESITAVIDRRRALGIEISALGEIFD